MIAVQTLRRHRAFSTESEMGADSHAEERAIGWKHRPFVRQTPWKTYIAFGRGKDLGGYSSCRAGGSTGAGPCMRNGERTGAMLSTTPTIDMLPATETRVRSIG